MSGLPLEPANRPASPPSWIALIIIAIWIFLPLLAHRILGGWEEAGKFGDSFGSVTSLFSALALVGVVYTIWQQRVDAITAESRRNQDQQAATRQIFQLALSTQLQSARALITEHRRAITQLNPAIGEVPIATTQLLQLKSDIKRDALSNPAVRRHEHELIERLTELVALQGEISHIREKLGEFQAEKINV